MTLVPAASLDGCDNRKKREKRCNLCLNGSGVGVFEPFLSLCPGESQVKSNRLMQFLPNKLPLMHEGSRARSSHLVMRRERTYCPRPSSYHLCHLQSIRLSSSRV